MEPSPAIHFSEVTKRFGKFTALDGLSLRIEQGELYGLLGPNGAGKTTAIRVLTGLLVPTSGTAKVLGFRPTDPKVRPLVGYMPQETALYVDLTVRENLRLFGRLYGMDRDARESRIAEMLEFIELEKWADAVIANLSGGMKHRASLAAALLPKPRLLVLDEPTVGVDPELRSSFWERFHAMDRDGTTILLTTHYMDEALQCRRVGLIRAGKLLLEGTPSEVMDRAGARTMEEAFLRLASRHASSGEGAAEPSASVRPPSEGFS
jgi:ABC-2 type transport system ATP-binding protein